MTKEPQFNLIVLRCADLDSSVRFYENIGLRFSHERHGQGVEHMTASAGHVTIELYPQGDGPNTTALRIGFRVTSIDDVIAGILPCGGTILKPVRDTEWGRRAVIVDPDGHRVELTELP